MSTTATNNQVLYARVSFVLNKWIPADDVRHQIPGLTSYCVNYGENKFVGRPTKASEFEQFTENVVENVEFRCHLGKYEARINTIEATDSKDVWCVNHDGSVVSAKISSGFLDWFRSKYCWGTTHKRVKMDRKTITHEEFQTFVDVV